MARTDAKPAAPWQQALTALPGIGAKRAAQLAAAFGIANVAELLTVMPRRYEEPPPMLPLAAGEEGQRVRVAVRVRGASVWGPPRKRVLRVGIEDDSGRAQALYFNQAYLKEAFPEGREVVLEGRLSRRRGVALLSPRIVPPNEQRRLGLEPRYPEADGVPKGLLARAIRAALEAEWFPPERLPIAVRAAVGVPELPRALRDLHAPTTLEQVEAARRRLAWGEVLRFELRRRRKRPTRATDPNEDEEALWARILRRIPFSLTSDQEKALATLRSDLNAGEPMMRLLHGEVGSGKTAVAFALALAVVARGGQVALLAPTEILARQHLATFRSWLRGSRVHVVAQLGDDSQRERRLNAEALREHKAQIAIGTHALFGPSVEFAKLEFVIFDEQHRFGVRQKAALVGKGHDPHVLTMTATPIPRTLAWAQYGALEPCVLRQRPGTAGTIRTHVDLLERWPRLAAELYPRLQCGLRVFVVVPRIDGEGGIHEHAAWLAEQAWAGIPQAVVHGRLPGAELEAAVEAFRSGRIRALIGTTVVEVGLDVSAVEAMVILDAGRLGLASLHQLRGRLGRGAGAPQAECWMLATPESQERLRLLERCQDGFAVAEADLAERGPGTLLGTRQHGRSDFRLFDPLRDRDLVESLQAPELCRYLEQQESSPRPAELVAGEAAGATQPRSRGA